MTTKDLNKHHYHLTDEDLKSRVLFKDKLIIIIDKPAGIAVHPGPRQHPSLEDHFDALKFERYIPPTLAHRLDRDTSGCLILGRNKQALRKLGKLFETGKTSKTYWAIVHGGPKEDSGVVDGYLRKVRNPNGWYMKICKKNDPDAKASTTEWRVIKRSDKYSWLELHPKTGRTHQIRVHCQFLGCPIIGDWVYAPPAPEGEELPLLHLLARSISVPLYTDEPPIYAEAPVPAHMKEKIDLSI